MKNIVWIIISLLISFSIYSCEKEHAKELNSGSENIITPTEPPAKIEVIKGNNQVGFSGRLLPDTIYVEIIPDEMNDADHYFYYFNDGRAGVVESIKMTDRVLLKIQWALGMERDQKMKMYLYSTLNKNTDGSFAPIASVDICATCKSPWSTVFTYDNGLIGPGSFCDMHFTDDQNGIVIGVSLDGNARTTDGGNTWSLVNTFRSDLYRFSFCDSMNGLVIVTNNWAYFTNDGGNTFYEADWTPPIVGHLSSNDYLMLDKNTIITIGRNGTIVKSVDSGKTWKKYNGFNFNNSLNSITSINKYKYFACGQVGKIVRTTDGGDTWTETDLLINNDLKKIYFINELVGFAGGTYGMLVRTTDGGNEWTILKTGLLFPIIDIHFFSNTLGYVVTSAGEIARTNDGGDSWELVNIDNYGVYDLAKVYFKDSETLLGLQGKSIFKYNLRDN